MSMISPSAPNKVVSDLKALQLRHGTIAIEHCIPLLEHLILKAHADGTIRNYFKLQQLLVSSACKWGYKKKLPRWPAKRVQISAEMRKIV